MKYTALAIPAALAMLASASPAAAGAIAANTSPITFDAGFGKISVDGQLTGLAFYQTNATHLLPGDSETYLDLDNAMIEVSKTDGFFQFYVAAGLYAFPTVGFPYDKATDQNSYLGPVPVAYAKLQLTDTFSISAGKLPTLVGAELAFTPQNSNIERGLLWFQEPITSRGVQANYASGPLSIAVSWNDGYYTNVWNTGSALISYTIDSSNTLAFDASVTPDYGSASGNQIYDLMYTYSADPWTVGPYVQYQSVNHGGGSEWGAGVLASYQLTPEWSLNGRAEYEDSDNSGALFVYGPGSKAWSFTVTPTYQKGIFFARGELSYTSLQDNAIGFGKAFNKDNQFRALFETGISF
ncbi:MAG TPA: outer membrane beta-barrel protein [Rhizomicrobium sp.]|nr:outer membrane beta-barrel protein [Rhizomicrobium sp.]